MDGGARRETYDWPIEWRLHLAARATHTYQSKMFFGTDPINGFQDAYTLVDARLTGCRRIRVVDRAVRHQLDDEVYCQRPC
jgi:hypothetical protein